MFHFNDIIHEGDVLAVGDIHGCARLFYQFLDWVRGSGARVILLGDLIDRGEDDLTVLNKTRDLLQDPGSWGLESFTVLRGNHEQMFLNAIDGHGMGNWIYNGGDHENLHLLIKHEDWLRQLPYYVTVGSTLFTHAGCTPGEDPALSMNSQTRREEFIWQRQPFLTQGPQFRKWTTRLNKVVFGHTPKSPLPYRVPSGVCVDTGAFRTGVLTCYNDTQDTFNQFELE